MTHPTYSTCIAFVLVLVVGVRPALSATPDSARERWAAAIARPTPLADSGQKLVRTVSIETAQPSRSGPPKAVTCVIGFTVFPLTGALLGMITGATGALATGRTLSDGFLTGSVVVGTALGVAAGAALCLRWTRVVPRAQPQSRLSSACIRRRSAVVPSFEAFARRG